MQTLSAKLRSFSELTGRLVAWLTLPMVAGTFLIVVLRYVFDLGWIWMQESTVWVHAAVFMLAAAYTLNRNEHVRVDVYYSRLSPRGQAWVDVVGTAVFLVPMAVFLIVTSADYVIVSWQIHEGSREAGGLPYPLTSLLKSFIPLMALLLLAQALAHLIDAFLTLAGPRQPDGGERSDAEKGA